MTDKNFTRTIVAASALALVAACSQQPASPSAESSAQTDGATASPTPEASPTSSAEADAPGRQHRYTSLKDCRVIRKDTAEMPFVETECAGLGHYSLRIADSDARQRMTLVPPSGELFKVPVDRIGGGGFSSFGDTAEWRGPDGATFEPDSLIVRYDVAEKPSPAPETSYLLVMRVGADNCLVRVVPPGPGQNDSARAAADDPGACKPG